MLKKEYFSTQKHFPLTDFNTFHVPVTAALFTSVQSITDIIGLFKADVFVESKILILGGGSNILFTKDFDGIVIKNNLQGISIIREDDNHCWVKCASGEIWHSIIMYCVERNLGGIENLSLIPGTVGAAPIQNIGAYGVELKDVLEEVESIDIETGETKIFTNADCKFGYRDSIFKNELKNKYFITNVLLKLNKHPEFHISYGAIQQTLDKMGITELSVKTISDAVIHIRKSKLPDPAVLGNAGSFFKNPTISKSQYEILKKAFSDIPGYKVSDSEVKVPAGWLIEQCGWKGKRVGNTGAHKDQALVLVNYGNATGKEIYNLAMEIKESVMKKFGIEINPEVNII
ncbi:MAG: UDP-N-acetylmuramate dehydrogenase [Fimbriimonadaceae bacterium]|nr:UDP-N-acetylmuramate dehydrogenase [Chitinophagales bacterium]